MKLLALASCALAPAALASSTGIADATPVPSRIEDVTLYPSTALVRRAADIAGPGKYVVRGLPAALDPENVRVRCTGADVLDVRVRSRQETRVADERVQGLRERVQKLEREQKTLADDRALAQGALENVQRLMKLETGPAASAVAPKSGAGWEAH